MVLLHYKKSDHNQFLYQTQGSKLNGEIADNLIEISNMRIQIDVYACAIEDLATHGPLKPEQIRGLTDPQLVQNALIVADEEKKKWMIPRKPQEDERFNPDKTQYRIGVIKNQQITQMMIDTSIKAKKLISYKNVDSKIILTLQMLKQIKQELNAALMISYPGYVGLGSWQPAKLIHSGQYLWQQINTNQIDYLDPKDSIMWWAGKQLLREKALNSYIGKNQKTKIIIKLSKNGSGAPSRQPAVDEETRVKLMAMYHKKQQNLKKIQSNNQDDYTNSSWANPNNLKQYLVNGGKDFKWK